MLETEKIRAMEGYLFMAPTTRLRAAGKCAVVPRVDLDRFRFRYKLDRIRLDVHLRGGVTVATGTTFQAVQAAIRAAIGETAYVEPMANEGSPSLRFQVNLQDPSHARIQTIRDALEGKFGLERAPSVADLELALDAFPVTRDTYLSDRAAALNLFRTHLLPDVSWRRVDIEKAVPRLVRGKGKANVHFLSRHPDVDGPAISDMPSCSLYVGRRGDPVEWVSYPKVLDRVIPGISSNNLPEEQSSARLEARVRQPALSAMFGINTVTDLTGAKLRQLHGLFRFVVPTITDWRLLKPGIGRSAAIALAYREVTQKFYRRGAWWVAYERETSSEHAGSSFLGMAAYRQLRNRSAIAITNFERAFFR